MSRFDLRQALRNLDIEVKPFGYGTITIEPGLRGYSTDRWLAINPDERWPVVVTFHEMTHILRGDTALLKKYQLDHLVTKTGEFLRQPSHDELERIDAYIDHKETNHDIIEAECHATAIITAQLTNTPFDFEREVDHLEQCYTRGRRLPEEVMARAHQTAKKIAVAGKVDARNYHWDHGLVAA